MDTIANPSNITYIPKSKNRFMSLSPHSTSYFTNIINKTALNSFNKWGGITFSDILSNYPKEIIDNCWLVFSQAILENYSKGKGTFIKNFGTFTFTNEEYSLEGTTNQYSRDIKKRNPVFIVSKEYIDYIKPGIYSKKYGLIYNTQKENKNISIVKLNFAKMSLALNITKEEVHTIIDAILKNMSDSIRRSQFKEKKIPNIGSFLIKSNIFGVKFDQNLIDDISEKSQKLYHIKKNFRFCMETKDSIGIRHRNINDIDKAERDIRSKVSTITKLSNSANTWLKNNMDIDIKKDIEDDDTQNTNTFYLNAKNNLNIKKEKNEFLVDQRYYRDYPKQDLYGLKIPQNILEGIYNNKNLLIRAMKQVDRHGDGIIPKFEFINTFHKQNCHHLLRIELIDKIVNLYLNNDESIIMIKYDNLLRELFKDIKCIIDNEYHLFPINKYKYSISSDNKRAISQNMFSRDTGNLHPKAISSIKKYNKLPKIGESEIRDIIEKICKISILLENKNKKDKMISYLELKDILEKYKIDINKELMVLILKYLNIENPNCFYIKDFINKINEQMMKSTCFDFRKSYNNTITNFSSQSNNKMTTSHEYPSINNLNTDYNNSTKLKGIKTNMLDKPNINTINIKEDSKNNEDSNLLTIKLIKTIKDKIFKKSNKIDNISLYFDHLLSYNICRNENIIYPDELERLFQLEQFNFTIPEIKSIFSFIDSKKDGYIDRIEFINAIKNVPHPLSTFINFMKNNGVTMSDIAYKMGYDLYNQSLNACLNSKLNRLSFQTKLKAVNDNFDNEYIYGLFNYISEGKNEIEIRKFFDMINYNNDDTYKNLSQIKDDIINMIMDIIPKCVSFSELKNNFVRYDKQLKGEINSDTFLSIMRKYIGQKIKQQDLLHFLRINKLIDNKNIIKYSKFLMVIYLVYKDDLWLKSLEAFRNFIIKECSKDLFIFIVKINNLCNNISIKKTVDIDRMQRFIRDRIGQEVDINTILKFDYNNDGIISMDDLKNIILKYIDKNFFETKESLEENYKINERNKNKLINKKLYLELKKVMNKQNITVDNLFFFLDKKKDNILDFDEFKTQLPLLLNITEDKNIEIFFNYLDEYQTKKIDINTFRNKFKILNNEMLKNHENDYVGNSTIENLLLEEFKKWLKVNKNLCDTELFPLLDHDHDGIISIKDIKYFANKILYMPPNELNDTKILHFIVALSLTNSNYLVLADVQNVMKNLKDDKTQEYENNIYTYCNEGINEKNQDINWIHDVINRIGIFINEIYDNDIKKFYDTYNTTNFRNQGQGLSFDNFTNFLDKNYQILEQYHINKIQQKILFKYISQNTNYITLSMLQKIFGDNKYNFYQKMHFEIKKFLHENYPTSEDAFKFFHSVKTLKQETPTYNDINSKNIFITKNEFFKGINKMFPNKYRQETLNNYYNKLFGGSGMNNKENKDDINNSYIKFSEFNYIYYSDFKFDNEFSKSLKKDSKILTTRIMPQTSFSSFLSPFEVEKHEKFETPYDLDPLLKAKKLILSSKIDFKKEFLKIIKESSNGMANQFEFRNIVKKLDIGLTNIEIEDIIHKSGMGSDGKINLVDFYNYIIDENRNMIFSKKHVLEQLKEIKQLIYKYYTNPRLAFELNDLDVKGKIDFDIFKKIIYDLYKRELKSSPSYSVLKYVYDYIDIRKDGLIDLNEWNQIFSRAEGKLDLTPDIVLPRQLNLLRQWENSDDIIEIYKMIAKNRKLIKDKVKIFALDPNTMLIKDTDMIYVLKEILGKIKLSQTQWKMIVSIGDRDKSGIIDYNIFINVVDTTAKMGIKHPVIA